MHLSISHCVPSLCGHTRHCVSTHTSTLCIYTQHHCASTHNTVCLHTPHCASTLTTTHRRAERRRRGGGGAAREAERLLDATAETQRQHHTWSVAQALNEDYASDEENERVMNLFTQRRKRQRLTEEQRDEMKKMKKESTYERFIQKAREFGVGLIQDTEEKKVF